MMLQPLPEVIDDLSKVLAHGDEILEGLGRTLWLYGVALFFGFLFGLLLAITRLYGGRFLSRIATGYIELIRGTPLLVQIFFLFFLPNSINTILELQGLPTIYTGWYIQGFDFLGRRIMILSHGILTSFLMLSLNSAAYQAEYLRGAMASVSAGQLLASQSLGMSQALGIRHIVMPQALRRAIPAWSNEAAYLPKFTVVAFFVGVEDIFGKAHLIVTITFVSLMTYLIIALIFLILVSSITKVLDYIHEKTKIPGL